MTRRTTILAMVLAATQGHAGAADVSVQDAWARATAASAHSAAVYLSIQSAGGADRLTAIDTPVAGEASLHQTFKNGSVVGMRAVEGGLALSTSGPTVLAPGGYHIMLTHLRKQLVAGSSFPLTLTFAKAGKLAADVRVEAAGANGPTQDKGAGHDMDSMPGMSH